jgi:hypothetical protein
MRTDDPDLETEHAMEEWEPPVADELPRRPRRRLLTPVALVLAVVTVAALGFTGGVLVQKAQGGPGSGSQAAAGPLGFAGRPGGGQAPGGGPAAAGSVVNKRGKYLYVRDSSGNTVRVKTTSNSKVTRTASSKVRSIHPGDTVTIEGTKGRDGTITAAQITASAKGTSAGGFPGGGFAGGGGGGFPGGGAARGAAGAAPGG